MDLNRSGSVVTHIMLENKHEKNREKERENGVSLVSATATATATDQPISGGSGGMYVELTQVSPTAGEEEV